MSIGAIDKRGARRAFERAAAVYDQAAILQREIADRMLERLDYVRLDPRTILDLGAGTGYAVEPLQRRYRKARVLALDFALNMVREARRRGSWLNRPRCVCADAEALPLVDGSVDLVFSNATLQWWSGRAGGWVGATGGTVLGLLCAAIAVLAVKGIARRTVMSLLVGMATVGVGGLTAGIIAACVRQPYGVFFPLLLGGVLCALMGGLGLALYPRVYQDIQLRRIRAKDA